MSRLRCWLSVAGACVGLACLALGLQWIALWRGMQKRKG